MPKKSAVQLLLPIKKIGLQPQLSSPPRIRIQGGSLSVTDREGRQSLRLILDDEDDYNDDDGDDDDDDDDYSI